MIRNALESETQQVQQKVTTDVDFNTIYLHTLRTPHILFEGLAIYYCIMLTVLFLFSFFHPTVECPHFCLCTQ